MKLKEIRTLSYVYFHGHRYPLEMIMEIRERGSPNAPFRRLSPAEFREVTNSLPPLDWFEDPPVNNQS